MKKNIEKIIYVLLVIGSIYLGILLISSKSFYSWAFLIAIPTVTIIYSFYTQFKYISMLPSLFILYIFLSFFLFTWIDAWNTFTDEPLEEQESQEKRTYFIPEEWHYLYPEEWFKDLAVLKDDFHWIKHDYQENLQFQENTFQIYKGFQWWIYSYEAWLEIPFSWDIYLKAYSLLSNTELSEDRLKKASTLKVFNTQGKVQLFSLLDKENRPHFSIYEWGWGEYYGARFEVWYVSDKDLVPKKLLEDYYIIEGWER